MSMSLIRCLIVAAMAFAAPRAVAAGKPLETRFVVSFPASARAVPASGRVVVIVSKAQRPDPRVQLVYGAEAPPFFGKDVENLHPGQDVVLGKDVRGYAVRSLDQLPAGDYFVEAFLNLYTRTRRADSHTVLVHFDWTGEQPSLAPGNLHSAVKRIHLDPAHGYDVHLSLDQKITLADFTGELSAFASPRHSTRWVKVFKFRSPRLTKFWGHPMYVGATVLVPAGYAEHPHSHYPVVFNQGHFDQATPWGFDPDPKHETPDAKAEAGNFGTGYEFYQAWTSAHFPRFFLVTFQEPCPYYDDGYSVNSANCGPYGDVVMKEIIPFLESHLRMIRQPYARILEGGSTGGWESLALQLRHPGFFGGAWVFDPDPVDFRSFQLTDLYHDKNAFVADFHSQWHSAEKPWNRTKRGQPYLTVREDSAYEEALGARGRSGHQLDGWWAIFDPVAADGYPQPMWNMRTGEIDPAVVAYARDHGYDLSDYIRSHWSAIGPQLVGKLHFFVGDMDSYYLNLAVYRLQDFLQKTRHPNYAGTFVYGRPMKGHGWHPMSWSQLLRDIAAQVRANAPAGADKDAWNY